MTDALTTTIPIPSLQPILHATVCALALGACASSDEPVVGSGQPGEQRLEIDAIQRVVIDLPFDVSVEHGEDGEIRISGEDNLVDLIGVDDDGAGTLTLETDPGLRFVQNRPIRIALPYATLERLSMYGDGIELADDPRAAWNADGD